MNNKITTNWLEGNNDHSKWLYERSLDLIELGKKSVQPYGGFGYLDKNGNIDHSHDSELWLACRNIHIMSIGKLMGIGGCSPIIEHGINAIINDFEDKKNGGFFSAVSIKDGKPTQTIKESYAHAFVMLAASSAIEAGFQEKATPLLNRAIDICNKHFWEPDYGFVKDAFVEDFSSELEEYKGVNANMHTVEAFLAVYMTTKKREFLDRAFNIVDKVINQWARNNNWRIPEHFTVNWEQLLEYNEQEKEHKFKPYGATVGHALEWSRLCLQTMEGLKEADGVAPEWMLNAGKNLFSQAVKDGWDCDGKKGFVYTTDWQGKPIIRKRMHWVVCEAIDTAAVLYSLTKDTKYENLYCEFWDFVDAHLLDKKIGGWFLELDINNKPSETVWDGKAELYHSMQATIIPRIKVAPAITPAIAKYGIKF